MDLEQDIVIGIVGGMGPQAGQALFDKIIRHTGAASDQEHLSVVLMSFPRHIVDRTAFLLGATAVNPAVNIVKIIRKLELAGARIIGIPCNTTHSPEIFDVILEELDKLNSRVKLLSILSETCDHIDRRHPYVRRIGLLTTNGTYKTGLYSNLLRRSGYEVVIPDVNFQNDVIHRMVYDPDFGIKSSPASIAEEVRALLAKALSFFSRRKADAIILGCTEFSLLLTENCVDNMLIVDSTDVLARALIREAVACTCPK